MTRGIEITPVDAPPDGARVCHYDQLEEGIKGRFPGLVPADGDRSVVEPDDAAALDACDVVKYTKFYRIGPVGALETDE